MLPSTKAPRALEERLVGRALFSERTPTAGVTTQLPPSAALKAGTVPCLCVLEHRVEYPVNICGLLC